MARPTKEKESRSEIFHTRCTQDTLNKVSNIRTWAKELPTDADVLYKAVDDLHTKLAPNYKNKKAAFVQPELPIKKSKSKK